MNKFLLPGIFGLLAVNLGVSGYALTRCCSGCKDSSSQIAVLPSPTIAPTPTTAVITPTAPVVVSDEKLLVEVNNIGACSYTNKSEFKLNEDHFITRIRTWYSWGASETEIPYKLIKDGSEVANGKLTRKDCDPYQRQWCIAADFEFNKPLKAGEYTLQVEKSQICQNTQSQNKGFIYVWGN
jgi:hypothetical protein